MYALYKYICAAGNRELNTCTKIDSETFVILWVINNILQFCDELQKWPFVSHLILELTFCPYVISTLYQLLEEYKWELSKDTISCALVSQL
jgi:hypothetical protein